MAGFSIARVQKGMKIFHTEKSGGSPLVGHTHIIHIYIIHIYTILTYS